MTEATLSTPRKPKKSRSGSVASLQAIAAQALDNADQEEAGPKRGPFRPEVWLNSRERGSARLAIHYFRTFDVIAVICITLLCAWAATPASLSEAIVGHVAPFAIGALIVLGLMRSLGLYRFDRAMNAAAHMGRVAGIVATATMVALGVGLASGNAANLPAYLIWGGLVLITLNALHMAWTDLVSRWRKAGALTPNVVLVGATRHAEKLIQEALKRRDINVLGIFDDRLARSPRAIEGVPVLGSADDLLTHHMTPYVDRIVLAIDPKAQSRVRELNSRLRVLPNEVTLLVEPEGAAETNWALDRVAATPLASLEGPLNDDRRAFHKRIQDLILGSIALLLLAPVMGLIALAIKLDSPGPVFFRQRRHGFNHEEIVVWKFRSMRQETADATASRQVTADDDRVTRIGRFIRNTSLDELPQLLNVLAGEMSLVGPRPHAIGMKTGHTESARLVAEYAHRHRIKPGMTGWAAVNGSRGPLHSAQDVRRRVQLDVDYIERQSLWLDLWIMAITVPVLLGDRAAVR